MLNGIASFIVDKISKAKGISTNLIMIFLVIWITAEFFPVESYLKATLSSNYIYITKFLTFANSCLYILFVILVILFSIFAVLYSIIDSISKKYYNERISKVDIGLFGALLAVQHHLMSVFKWIILGKLILAVTDGKSIVESLLAVSESVNNFSPLNLIDCFYKVLIFFVGAICFLSFIGEVWIRFFTIPHIKEKEITRTTTSER